MTVILLNPEYKIFDFKDKWTIESVSVSKLDTNERINVVNNEVSWNPIDSAYSYVIYVNGNKVGETTKLSFYLKDYIETDKVEVVAIDLNGDLLSKVDNFTLPKTNTNADENTNSNSAASNITYNFTDSHNKTYTNSPVVTNSPNYIGTVSGNSTVINMGSIYNASGKAKVTNNVDIDGSKYSQKLESGEASDDA